MFKLKLIIGKLNTQKVSGILVILTVTIIGVKLFIPGHAQSTYASSEAESGTLTSPVQIQSDNSASGGKYVQFGYKPTSALAIHLDGDQLVNGQGKIIRLLGVDAEGTEAACLGTNPAFGYGSLDSSEASVIASWKINAVRVPLNEDCWLGINGAPAGFSGQAYQSAIESWVTDLNSAGIIAILDLHHAAPGSIESTIGWPMADEDHSPAFWTSVATAFKNNPAVMFDLYNEPYIGNSGTTTSTSPWTCWLSGCSVGYNGVNFTSAGIQQLVNTVRATGATQPIMLGGLNYSADPCGYTNKFGSSAVCPELANMPTDSLNQVAVSFHNYVNAECSDVTCWNWMLGVLNAANIPLVTGEFGEQDCSDNFMNSYMDWADTNNESYIVWSWNTYDTGQTTCVLAPTNGFETNYDLLQNWDGTPNAIVPQAANYKAHLAAVSPY